jgi:hypothetical protein
VTYDDYLAEVRKRVQKLSARDEESILHGARVGWEVPRETEEVDGALDEIERLRAAITDGAKAAADSRQARDRLLSDLHRTEESSAAMMADRDRLRKWRERAEEFLRTLKSTREISRNRKIWAREIDELLAEGK